MKPPELVWVGAPAIGDGLTVMQIARHLATNGLQVLISGPMNSLRRSHSSSRAPDLQGSSSGTAAP